MTRIGRSLGFRVQGLGKPQAAKTVKRVPYIPAQGPYHTAITGEK